MKNIKFDRAYIVVKNTKLIIVVARNLLAELQTFSAASSNQKHVIVQIPWVILC